MVLGQGSLFSSRPLRPPPTLPQHSSPLSPCPSIYLVPTILGSCHLIQLITGWDGLWETRLGRGSTQPQIVHCAQGTIYQSIYTA